MGKVLDFNRIGVIDQELLEKIKTNMIPNILEHSSIYHYTSIGGLKEILQGKKLWFTHIDYMNDRDEVIAGAEQLKKVGLMSCDEDYGEIIKNEAKQLMRKNQNAFVCCFSMKQDELAMWNYYTKDVYNQGYNIGFDYKGLMISLLQKNPILDGCRFSFGKVDYCIKTDTYVDKMHDYSFKVMEETLATLARTLSDSKVEKVDQGDNRKYDISVVKYYGNEPMFRSFPTMDVIYFMKRPCFSTEAEFRVVIQVPDKILKQLKDNGKYKYRISNGLLIPYLELEFDISDVTGITLSPTINGDLAERSIKDYCAYCDIDVSCFQEGINKSVIPLRF